MSRRVDRGGGLPARGGAHGIPDHAITIVVPFDAGGSRAVGQVMGRLVSQSIDAPFDRPVPFNPEAFAPLCLLSNDPMVAIVRQDSAWHGAGSLVSRVRKSEPLSSRRERPDGPHR